MAKYKENDIRGFFSEDKVFCSVPCFMEIMGDGPTEQNIILNDAVDEKEIYFCDNDLCGCRF